MDIFEDQACEGITRLQRSNYARLAARGESYWGLAHQDYGWGNAQIGPGGVWVIDLDGVVFDLPIRDLRKLITGCMSDKWDLQWAKGMIIAYHKANPIEPGLYEVFLIDLAMPNEFYQFVKEVVYDPVTFLNARTKNDWKNDPTALLTLSSGSAERLEGGKEMNVLMIATEKLPVPVAAAPSGLYHRGCANPRPPPPANHPWRTDPALPKRNTEGNITYERVESDGSFRHIKVGYRLLKEILRPDPYF